MRVHRAARFGRCRVLAAVVMIGWGAVVAAPQPPHAAGAASPATGEPATPVFSARRVPGLVQSLAAGPALGSELDAVVEASPPTSCVRVDVEGRTLFSSGGDAALIPASNQKIVTAQLALDVLGADHRFRTDVGGVLSDDGVVEGDLYLVGGGDPVLRTADYAAYLGDAAGQGTSLEDLADAVADAGVRHVTGSVVGDESRYDTERQVPTWPDDRYLQQHQIGPLSALEVNQGFVAFPATWDVEAVNALEAAADPAVAAARAFTDALTARGVQVDGEPSTGTRPDGTPLVAGVRSPPLTAIVSQLLTRSDNEIAELLVKEAGFLHGTAGSTAAGLAVFARTFAELGLPDDGVVMHDGSGLGYDNRLTCALLVALLDRAGENSVIGRGLAVAGETGTLRERFTDADLQGRLRAKTGSLDRVTSLSGFADPTGAPPVTFAYIANGAPVTPQLLSIQEDLGRALVTYAAHVPLDDLGPR